MINVIAFVVSVIIIVAVALGNNQDLSVRPSPKPSDVLPQQESATLTPTQSPEVSSSPTPEVYKEEEKQNVLINSAWIYPSAMIITNSKSAISLLVEGDVNTITDWYKQRIEDTNMNVKTFVKTNTNGKVINELVRARAGEEIRVEINQNPGEKVKIEVSFNSES